MKNPTEALLWAVAKNPQDHPKYADEAPAPAPVDRANTYEAKREAWAAKRLAAKKRADGPRIIACSYCQDRTFVMVYEWWAVGDGETPHIPHPCVHTVEDGQYCGCGGVTKRELQRLVLMDPLNGSGVGMGSEFYMAPCDCHSGFRGCKPYKDEEGKEVTRVKVRKFAEIFGSPLALHWLGNALNNLRGEKLEQRMLSKGPSAFPLANMSRPEPDDPPEHSLELMDYPESVTPAPARFTPDQQKRQIERMAEQAGIELETYHIPEAFDK